jgi:hypothetical protein
MDCRVKPGNDEIAARSRDTSCPSFAIATPVKDSPPRGSGAPRGASDQFRAGTDRRCHLPCLRARCAHFGARSPAGALLRHSPPATTPMAQLQNRVSSRRGLPSVLPACRTSPELSTLRADRSFCRPTGAPKPPGSGVHRSARGHRPLLRLSKVPSRKAPSLSRMSIRNIISDDCQQYPKRGRTWLREC